jgi:glycosyltransferase involved in cell wall biosynthesis
LRKLVRELDISVVHSHMYRANVPATALKVIGEHVKVVGHYHNVGTWESTRQRLLDRWLANKRDMNLAVSEAVRRDVISHLQLPPSKVRTLRNGVNLDEFHPVAAAARHAIRERLGLPASAKVVVMVARLVSQKNQSLVIESAMEVLKAVPRAHFLFVGDGPDNEALKELASVRCVRDHVTFLGKRDDVPDILAASDVSVLPSTREGFSNAVLESMACGVPVIASNVGGNAEVIDNGINGFLLDMQPAPSPAPNASRFVRYLKRLLLEDDFRMRMGAVAHSSVEAFSIDTMVRETEQAYLDLLGG